jgi:hypothetical protein
LRIQRDGSDAVTTLTVSAGLGRTIVFNEGTYYPPIHGTAVSAESREHDRYVVVQTENLPVLARRLGVEGTQVEIGDIVAAVVEFARAGEAASLAAVRRMLEVLEVPYDEETWISY